ncbi:MAG: outer membrane lipoprotein-sorting protein [Candidatus Binatia bacterium]
MRMRFVTLSLSMLIAGGTGPALAWTPPNPEAEALVKQKVGSDYTQMINGKPYKITPGSQAGTYNVSWGDESLVWQPKPWQHKDYKVEGPAIYDRWIQPDLPYPWDSTLDERFKMSGRDVHSIVYTSVYFSEFASNYLTRWAIDLTSPDGVERNKELFEWSVAYRRDPSGLPPDQIGKVTVRYMFTFVAPDDFRGLGMSTTVYTGDKANDEFLYSPSSRKIRRLPQGARQDFIPGTIVRWEDFPQVKPFDDIEYKIVGTTLYKGQPDGTFGFTVNTKGEQVGTGMDGVGEPCVIMELTPKGSYWYAKQRRIIGLKSMNSWFEEAFDTKGEVIRRRVNRRAIAKGDPRLQNDYEGLEPWQIIWGQEYFLEPKSGFQQAWYMNEFWINYDKMPRDIVNNENLQKEPVRKILFWE